MSELVKKVMQLKEKMEKASKNASKAEGALDQLRSELKKEYETESLKDAECLLDLLREELKEKEDEFLKAAGEFDEEFGESLES